MQTNVFGGLYADKVYTVRELRSKSADVLDLARHRPVTISRNSEQFALLNRDLASCLVRGLDTSTRALNLIAQALTVYANNEPAQGFDWLTVFGKDDLLKMAQEIGNEVLKAGTDQTSGWDMVDALMHEWHESALVAGHDVLSQAIAEPAEEMPIPIPSSERE